MKQTAVEWLEEKFTNSNADFINWAEEYFEQSKEMEKQQIIESYCQGCYDITKDDSIFPREKSEQYYNETFNK